MFSSYVLVIFLSNGLGGEEAVQIPMTTIDLCEQARKDYANSVSQPGYDLKNTVCLRVK